MADEDRPPPPHAARQIRHGRWLAEGVTDWLIQIIWVEFMGRVFKSRNRLFSRKKDNYDIIATLCSCIVDHCGVSELASSIASINEATDRPNNKTAAAAAAAQHRHHSVLLLSFCETQLVVVDRLRLHQPTGSVSKDNSRKIQNMDK